MDLAKIRKKLKESREKTHGLEEAPDAPDSPDTGTPQIGQSNEQPPVEEEPQEPQAPQAPQAPQIPQAPQVPDWHEGPRAPEAASYSVKARPATVEESRLSYKKETVAAEAGAPAAPAEEILDLLAFKLADEDYAFPITGVEEIIKPQRITPLPRAQEHIMGITSLRGKIIPVLALKKKLRLPGEVLVNDRAARIVVLRGPSGSIGAWVDRIMGVLRLPVSSLREPPGNLSNDQARFIEAVVLWEGRFVSLVKAGELVEMETRAEVPN